MTVFSRMFWGMSARRGRWVAGVRDALRGGGKICAAYSARFIRGDRVGGEWGVKRVGGMG